jgi:hypothetical protein
MSYDLAVWHAGKPITATEALAIHAKLCDGDISVVQPHASLNGFLAELVRSYPAIDAWPMDEIDSCPWSCSFDTSEGHVLICMVYSRAHDIVPFVESLAGTHDLVCFDPQRSFVAYPPTIARMPHLRIVLEDWTVIDNPSADNIEAALNSLHADGNAFAILEVTDMTFMQVLLQPEGTYVIEHRAGAAHRHYQAVTRDLGSVVNAFQAYAAGDDSWQGAFGWRKIRL